MVVVVRGGGGRREKRRYVCFSFITFSHSLGPFPSLSCIFFFFVVAAVVFFFVFALVFGGRRIAPFPHRHKTGCDRKYRR
ncbi:hypothetical protein TRSC58_07584 [Trypanosoma rangeli SC58]|uniref:Transmembrane protein n=1 Tax=Trypanosoma rangeli SC58 TaxID=429131 RepID=A0A061IRT9_TRYRA|nr:hypothetical protein TRSC58_07584 [Trypanosoma rangeli SC58]